MSGSTKDLDFMGDLEAIAKRGGRWWGSVLLFAIIAFFIVFIVWANWAELDRVTRGQGQVIPSRQIQVVQNLEGGIVSRIYVREGDVVEQGQPVMQIDNTSFVAAFREAEVSRMALIAMLARLDAEIFGEEPQYPDSIMSSYPNVVAAENALLQARTRELKGKLETLLQRAFQREQESAELKSRIRNYEKSRKLIEQEIEIITPNIQRGSTPKIELVRLNQRLTTLDGDLNGARLALPRIQASLKETKTQMESERAAFLANAQEQRNQIQTQLARLEESSAADRDRVARTEVKAPVNGVVNSIMITTEGGVIQPGMPLMEIVPIDDSLIIEARISPKDVAFLRPGQAVQVKLTAYEFARYGSLDGEVTNISADTMTSEDGQKVYEIMVRTDKSYLGTEDDQLPIIPGMVAEVDILTGKRTVLEYLLVPIDRAKQRALREP